MDIDGILDKVYSKATPYMGHNGWVDDEESNEFERDELKQAIQAEVLKMLSGLREKAITIDYAIKPPHHQTNYKAIPLGHLNKLINDLGGKAK